MSGIGNDLQRQDLPTLIGDNQPVNFSFLSKDFEAIPQTIPHQGQYTPTSKRQ